MADNLYDFEALRAAGTTFVIDDGTGIDWVFINGTYPAVPGHTGPNTTMSLYDGRYYVNFGLVTAVTVWDSATTFYTISFTNPIENIRGSASDDRIDGNDLANVLVGDATDVAGGQTGSSAGSAMTRFWAWAVPITSGAATMTM